METPEVCVVLPGRRHSSGQDALKASSSGSSSANFYFITPEGRKGFRSRRRSCHSTARKTRRVQHQKSHASRCQLQMVHPAVSITPELLEVDARARCIWKLGGNGNS